MCGTSVAFSPDGQHITYVIRRKVKSVKENAKPYTKAYIPHRRQGIMHSCKNRWLRRRPRSQLSRHHTSMAFLVFHMKSFLCGFLGPSKFYLRCFLSLVTSCHFIWSTSCPFLLTSITHFMNVVFVQFKPCGSDDGPICIFDPHSGEIPALQWSMGVDALIIYANR